MHIKTDCSLYSDEQLRYLDIAWPDFLEKVPCWAHLKDVQTGKYIYGNSLWIESLGLKSPNDIVGLTIDDLSGTNGIYTKWNFSRPFVSWKNALSETASRIEDQAKKLLNFISEPCLGFTHEGFVRIGNFVKCPVFHRTNRKIVAILTYDQDITLQLSLFYLFQVYQKFYPERKAIQLFLMYLEIDSYFHELPTYKVIQELFGAHKECSLYDKAIDSITAPFLKQTHF